MSAATWNLLRSDGGIELAPEICLRVVELLIDSEPGALGRLLPVSKHEVSVMKTLTDHDVSLTYLNFRQPQIISSRVPSSFCECTVTAQTYSWFLELRCRKNMTEFLINHELTQMEEPAGSWPTLDVPKAELQTQRTLFKRNGLLLLYRLADCITGLRETMGIRETQACFLESLSPTDLATLGVMVELMGHNFFVIMKNSIIQSGLADGLSDRAPELSTSRVYNPSPVPPDESITDNGIRECMCVFEDLVQRYGPYFAWAYLQGHQETLQRPDLWARQAMQDGLDNMNAFELGYTMSYASLQSIVWRVFCRRKNCSPQNRWIMGKQLVEAQMAKYKI